MIPKPKFELGDRVKIPFDGEVEGVAVRVEKTLVVTGVYLDKKFRGVRIFYDFNEDFTLEHGPLGKVYSFNEEHLKEFDRLHRLAADIADAQT